MTHPIQQLGALLTGRERIQAVRLVWLALSVLVTVLTLVTRVQALTVPKLEGRVNDRAGILSPSDEERITKALEAHERATGQEFAVLTLESLEGDALEDFSIRTVEAWKLGRDKQDDGLLLLVVKNDRKVRIEVGHGLEGTITDALSSRVVRNVLVPAFKSGDYATGIHRAVEVLVQTASGGAVDVPDAPPRRDSGRPDIGTFLALLFVLPFIFFGFVNNVRRRFWGTGYGGFGGGSFSGGGFGGGGGGGFSGGGGSFGGGGASGSW